MREPIMELRPRTETIADLVRKCARHEIPFSGEGSLCARVAAMGYRTTSLYEMVIAEEAALASNTEGK